MHQGLKILFLAVCLLVAAFFANYYGYVSIPWLAFDSVPTYGGNVQAADGAVKQLMEDEEDEEDEKSNNTK